jgi:hypothetical protein
MYRYFKLFAVSIGINCILWLVLGMFHMKIPSDGNYYLAQADVIIKTGVGTFIKMNLVAPYYWGFPLFLAAAKILLGDIYINILLIGNFFLTCLMPIVLVQIYQGIFKGEKGTVILFLLAIFCLDILQWSNFLVTDLYSLFFSLVFLCLVIKIDKINVWLSSISILLIGVFLLTLRGSNLLLIIPCVIYLFGKGRKGIPGIVIIGVLVLAITLLSFSKTSQNNGLSVQSRYQVFLQNLKKGEVINDRPYYSIQPFNKTNDNLAIYAIRLYAIRALNYWRFYSDWFSKSHNFFNLIYFPSVYLSAVFYFLRKKKAGDKSSRVLILGIIILYFVANCITMLDYDWRYRVPVLALLLIFAANGIQMVIQIVSDRRKVSRLIDIP